MCERRHNARIGADRPADAALDQILKTRIAPGPLIVSPGGIEHAAFAVRANPSPRLALIWVITAAFLAVFEDRAVSLVMLRMNVSLVPAFKAAKAVHDRVLILGEDRAERAGAMPLELSADKLDIFGRVQKAVRRAVQRDKT